MIVALFGAPGSGKDSTAKILKDLFGFKRIAFADKVRELAYLLRPEIRNIVDTHGWENAKREFIEVRCVLESVGNGVRQVLGESTWLDAALDEHELDDEDFVITDLRKQNEYRHLKYLGATFIYIRRPGFEKRPGDEWKDCWADYVIENDGGTDDLKEKVASLVMALGNA